MISRRDVLKGLAVAAVGIPPAFSALTAVRRGDDAIRATQPGSKPAGVPMRRNPGIVAAPPPWDIVSPLVAGSKLGDGWRLESLSPVVAGASIVVLAKGATRRERVHICRNSGVPSGEASTRFFDLVIMNRGIGSTPTEESLGCAVLRLARIMQENEGRGAGQEAMAHIETHEARVARYIDEDATLA
jgi:hypothetical protein